ncbi:ubiE/COQ5 methyltransferase [Xylariaceae sp. FL0804]|nr:ubiE/COQ5 methyltransferase [Xylariaceae sp. FL0804]
MSDAAIYDRVAEHYSAASRANNAAYSHAVASAFGYSAEELAAVPEDANLGLSCGNPLAIANLREGEVVIDLGSGAGFDVFQAAAKVGPTGQAIGVDMNKDMLARADRIKTETKRTNVRFVESEITAIDLPSGSADCIISNCVINLVPEARKQRVFDEVFRLLRPGGRLAVSDILARRPLPPALREDMALYVGCVAGASQVQGYDEYLRKAGFRDVLITDTKSNLNTYLEAAGGENGDAAPNCCVPAPSSCCTPKSAKDGLPEIQKKIAKGSLDFNEWAGSYKIFAVKPT